MQCAPCGYGDMYFVLCGMYSFEPMFLFGTSSHHIIQVLPRKISWNFCIIFSPHILYNRILISPLSKLRTCRIRFTYVGIQYCNQITEVCTLHTDYLPYQVRLGNYISVLWNRYQVDTIIKLRVCAVPPLCNILQASRNRVL